MAISIALLSVHLCVYSLTCYNNRTQKWLLLWLLPPACYRRVSDWLTDGQGSIKSTRAVIVGIRNNRSPTCSSWYYCNSSSSRISATAEGFKGSQKQASIERKNGRTTEPAGSDGERVQTKARIDLASCPLSQTTSQIWTEREEKKVVTSVLASFD